MLADEVLVALEVEHWDALYARDRQQGRGESVSRRSGQPPGPGPRREKRDDDEGDDDNAAALASPSPPSLLDDR